MSKSYKKLFAAPLAALVLSSFVMTPIAEARGGGFGGGGHAGARAGGMAHGGERQIDNSRRDVRASNVRSTSVTNVNRNVNVDVDRHGGCCGGWDNGYYHPVATAAAVTATVAVTAAVVGSIVRTIPPNCVPVNYGGIIYQQCGTTWYQPQGGQYIVINPPY